MTRRVLGRWNDGGDGAGTEWGVVMWADGGSYVKQGRDTREEGVKNWERWDLILNNSNKKPVFSKL